MAALEAAWRNKELQREARVAFFSFRQTPITRCSVSDIDSPAGPTPTLAPRTVRPSVCPQGEVRAKRQELSAVETHLRRLLASLEDRERKVVSAEAALAADREMDRRELQQRLAEAQGAVRKLQGECEHQLAMERDRTAEAARQRDAAEARLAVHGGRPCHCDCPRLCSFPAADAAGGVFWGGTVVSN